jgi:hypothetical protein
LKKKYGAKAKLKKIDYDETKPVTKPDNVVIDINDDYLGEEDGVENLSHAFKTSNKPALLVEMVNSGSWGQSIACLWTAHQVGRAIKHHGDPLVPMIFQMVSEKSTEPVVYCLEGESDPAVALDTAKSLANDSHAVIFISEMRIKESEVPLSWRAVIHSLLFFGPSRRKDYPDEVENTVVQCVSMVLDDGTIGPSSIQVGSFEEPRTLRKEEEDQGIENA